MCDNPKSKTCAFSCVTEKEFTLKGANLQKIKTDFEEFKKENNQKIPSERMNDSQLETAYTNRGISLVNSANLISCPAGTKLGGKFYHSYNSSFPLDSGQLDCVSEAIPMSQICPDKGKRIQDSEGAWICGTNSCRGKIVYENERRHYICVDCPQGKPDFEESLAWRNSDDFPEKCMASSSGSACILCRVDE